MTIDPFLNELPKIIPTYPHSFSPKDLQDLETMIIKCETDPTLLGELLLEWLQDHEDFTNTLLDFVENTRQLDGKKISPMKPVDDEEIIRNYFEIFLPKLKNINKMNNERGNSPENPSTSFPI
jgi:hypothetical protein